MKISDNDIDKICGLLEKAVSGPRSEFLASFLSAYGFANTTIKKTIANGPDSDGRYSIRQKLLYMVLPAGSNVEKAYLDALETATHKERFVVVTDYERLMAKDMLYDKGIDVPFDELPDSYEFFLPWCGRETIEQIVENPADVKAATQMGHLFESIKKDNEDNAELTEEALNVFLTRLLFCLFADDTHIFSESQFRNALQRHTAEDGSSVQTFLEGLFDVLDIPVDQRVDTKDYYEAFPYVNGGLFQKHYPIPKFSKTSRCKLLECCASDWSAINPDIFGSMFQTVISEEQRRTLGQHYTSVSNIMKVLNPLFIDDLMTELDEIDALPSGKWKERKVRNFREKIAGIKVFDPACGSGNFLITAYKELCHLDMRAISMIDELPFVGIHLNNFYGIEIDDFPCEIARLSLWLAQHQINMECYEKYNNANPTLPLTASGHIVCGNALRLDWNEVCPAEDGPVYICGNPPFTGGQSCNEDQNEDKKLVLGEDMPKFGYIDYVACWFLRAAEYISHNIQATAAFVSTNSLFQGIQIPFYEEIKALGVEYFFAYDSFKWKNNASHVAGVTVTIVGMSHYTSSQKKRLINETTKRVVQGINAYLIDGEDIIVGTTTQSPMNLPQCKVGVLFADDGNLILSQKEKEELLKSHPEVKPLVKPLYGSAEFIKGQFRYCLWISDQTLELALSVPEIRERIERVKAFRLSSKDAGARNIMSQKPWQTREHPNISKSSIIIPLTSSERREYIPLGYLPAECVVTNLAYTISDAPLWLFAILTSRMHMAWVRTVAGKLETRIRYSNTLCYNTFPFPNLSENQKKALEDSAMRIIEARENHYENTMAQLYDPEKMPDDLRAAHESNDLLVDSLYRRSGFDSDSERLQELFRRYKEAISCQR